MDATRAHRCLLVWILLRQRWMSPALDVTRYLAEKPSDVQSGIIGEDMLKARHARTNTTWVDNRF
ncbi:hypothetical protein N7508_011166 [Penicillium antarcticum]|uniref:uncharacterized protein n=1 Tax=Penicillium antarcticum TaxID=416450 RepID=UPI002390AB98|nr:uncharacterized protein N7508_011143 [Penicillium antarcticum]XP_058314204.1 uncharacterized protein N7508_011166 [Penicillium antarcticum]KAJ5288368.1 hypothetical protein N7508_011143 [Penicillium antarcticum]KAJ5288391.1 hypothetical protein N7508_011166 [Penicillium antarcticum]